MALAARTVHSESAGGPRTGAGAGMRQGRDAGAEGIGGNRQTAGADVRMCGRIGPKRWHSAKDPYAG